MGDASRREAMVAEWLEVTEKIREMRSRASELNREAGALELEFVREWAPLALGDEILIRKSSRGGKARKYVGKVTAIRPSFSYVTDDRVVPAWDVRATNDAMWDFYTRYVMNRDNEYDIEFKGERA